MIQTKIGVARMGPMTGIGGHGYVFCQEMEARLAAFEKRS